MKLKAFFVFGYPKLSFIGGSSAIGSPRVESLVETFARLAGPIPREWRAIFISEKICREVVTHKVSKSNFKMKTRKPSYADKPTRRESLPKIAPIRRAYNVVADNTGLSSFI